MIVVGGGVIGTACALELTETGAHVRLLEQGRIGGGASGGASGFLAVTLPATRDDVDHALQVEGARAVAARAQQIRERLGVDVEHRVVGALRVAGKHERAELEQRAAWSRAGGFPARWVDATELHRLEPHVGDTWAGAVHMPDAAHVRSNLLVDGMAQLARSGGAEIEEGVAVHALRRRGGRVIGVETDCGSRLADHVLLATGTGGKGLGKSAEAIRPVRGQTIDLVTPPGWLGRMVVHPSPALLPRVGGGLAIGATVEPEAGHDTTPRVGPMAGLITAALQLAPALGGLQPARSWAGLRPAHPSGCPVVGPAGEAGLLLALGHEHAGIVLAALTGPIVADHVLRGFSEHPAAARWRPEGPPPAHRSAITHRRVVDTEGQPAIPRHVRRG